MNYDINIQQNDAKPIGVSFCKDNFNNGSFFYFDHELYQVLHWNSDGNRAYVLRLNDLLYIPFHQSDFKYYYSIKSLKMNIEFSL